MPPLFRHRHRLYGGVAIPVITGVTPNAGAVGDVVTITGSNFGAARGIGSVVFTNTAAPFSNSVTVPNILSWSDTQIAVKVPDGLTFPYVGSFIRVTTNTVQSANSAATFLWTGGAAKFVRATSQVMTAADNPSLSVGDIDFSIVGWVNPASIGAVSTLIAQGNTSFTNTAYLVSVNAAGNLSFEVTNGAGLGTTLVSTAGALSAGTWYCFSAVHDSVNNVVRIGRNGTENQAAYTNGSFDSALTVALGAQSNLANLLDGSLDGVALFKRVLSPADLTTLYNAGQGLNYASALALGGGLLTNLAAWWDLDGQGGSGATWVDRLGVSNLTAGTGTAAPTSVRGVR